MSTFLQRIAAVVAALAPHRRRDDRGSLSPEAMLWTAGLIVVAILALSIVLQVIQGMGGGFGSFVSGGFSLLGSVLGGL